MAIGTRTRSPRSTRYARAATCRQQILCAHFTGTDEPAACGRCDACRDPEAVRVARDEAPAGRAGDEAPAVLAAEAQQVILDAVRALGRKIGKGNLAKALRGSQAKAVTAHGLLHLPQHGALQRGRRGRDPRDDRSADRAAAAGAPRARKYPTLALPGASSPRALPRAPRAARDAARRPRQGTTSVTLALDSYRKRMARQLKWKAYMVFQRADDRGDRSTAPHLAGRARADPRARACEDRPVRRRHPRRGPQISR